MIHFTPADYALIACVTGMTVLMAYIHSPRAKSMIYMLPFPFTAALISTGRGVEATHLVGVTGVWVFGWIVWFLHTKLRVNVIIATLLALAYHIGFSLTMVRIIPPPGSTGNYIWFAATSIICIGIAFAYAFLPHRAEKGHRSLLSPYIKTPLIFILVVLLIVAKSNLRGFMPSFPMVTIFAMYEARHSLFSLVSRLPIMLVAAIPLLATIHLLLPNSPDLTPSQYVLPLAAGWAIYVPTYLAMDKIFTSLARPPLTDNERVASTHTQQ